MSVCLRRSEFWRQSPKSRSLTKFSNLCSVSRILTLRPETCSTMWSIRTGRSSIKWASFLLCSTSTNWLLSLSTCFATMSTRETSARRAMFCCGHVCPSPFLSPAKPATPMTAPAAQMVAPTPLPTDSMKLGSNLFWRHSISPAAPSISTSWHGSDPVAPSWVNTAGRSTALHVRRSLRSSKRHSSLRIRSPWCCWQCSTAVMRSQADRSGAWAPTEPAPALPPKPMARWEAAPSSVRRTSVCTVSARPST